MTHSAWQYFTMEELTCKCGCERMGMKNDFMSTLVYMRRILGFPFHVTSAYRCPEHNAKVSSTGLTGPHTTGKAIDIAISHQNAYRLVSMALDQGITGVGVSQKGTNRFIHLDWLDEPRPRIWSY
jgi:uncharacterized protein YcbK (DUF882 family)